MAGKKSKPGFNSPFGKLANLSAQSAPAKETKLSETRTLAEAKKVLAERERGAASAKEPTQELTTSAIENVSASEADEFLRAVGGVERLGPAKGKTVERVEPEKRLVSELPDEDSLALAELHALASGDTPFRVHESEEFYSGAATGVSQELVDRLKDGTFSYRRHVDLHGYTRDDGKAALIDFIAAARRDGERCVLVITGRGRSSPGGISVLREALPRWLGRAPLRSHVLAYCTARSIDGGPGAFYVLLRRVGSKPYGDGLAR